MAHYKMVVLTNPTQDPGAEERFNEWYDSEHIGRICAVDGFKSAQRYRLALPVSPNSYQYMAIYEIETDDIENVLSELLRRSKTFDMTDALDLVSYTAIYDTFGNEYVK